MFENVVANIVAVGALIILTVFGLGLLSTLAEPTPRGIPYRPSRPHHRRPEPRPSPRPHPHHDRPHPHPHPHPHPQPYPHHDHPHHEHKVGGCGSTRFGCCPNGRTARVDDRGSNCPTLDATGSTSTPTLADKHPEVPAYSHGSSSHPGTQIPRAATHPTMTHSQAPPQSTLLLISETASTAKEGFVGGMRMQSLFGGVREGLTAKEQSEAEENEEARIKTIESSAKKIIDKCCFNSNKELFDKFATLLDVTAAQMVNDLVGQAPHAIQTKDYSALQNGQKKIEDLTNLASAARRLSDIGPASI